MNVQLIRNLKRRKEAGQLPAEGWVSHAQRGVEASQFMSSEWASLHIMNYQKLPSQWSWPWAERSLYLCNTLSCCSQSATVLACFSFTNVRVKHWECETSKNLPRSALSVVQFPSFHYSRSVDICSVYQSLKASLDTFILSQFPAATGLQCTHKVWPEAHPKFQEQTVYVNTLLCSWWRDRSTVKGSVWLSETCNRDFWYFPSYLAERSPSFYSMLAALLYVCLCTIWLSELSQNKSS